MLNKPSTMATTDMTQLPTRSHMDNPGIKWRSGKPNYDQVNAKYLKEKSKNHQSDSLEKVVENLVKTWEMESTHKIDEKDWGCIDTGNYFFQVNGGPKLSVQDNVKMGNYNMLLQASPLYDVSKETNESSHSLFKTAFPDGFAWEVIEVISGPPKVSFTWRHWTNWTGPYKNQKPTGERIEMFGSTIAEVNDKLKIKSIEVFYDPSPMMAKLTKFCPIHA